MARPTDADLEALLARHAERYMLASPGVARARVRKHAQSSRGRARPSPRISRSGSRPVRIPAVSASRFYVGASCAARAMASLRESSVPSSRGRSRRCRWTSGRDPSPRASACISCASVSAAVVAVRRSPRPAASSFAIGKRNNGLGGGGWPWRHSDGAMPSGSSLPREARVGPAAASAVGAGGVGAHTFEPALLDLRERDAGIFDVVWHPPGAGSGAVLPGDPALVPVLPASCRRLADLGTNVEGARSGSRTASTAVPCVCGARRSRFPASPVVAIDAIVRLTWSDGDVLSGVLRSDGEELVVPSAPSGRLGLGAPARTVARRYLGLGVEHILRGYDHMLFVVGTLSPGGSPAGRSDASAGDDHQRVHPRAQPHARRRRARAGRRAVGAGRGDDRAQHRAAGARAAADVGRAPDAHPPLPVGGRVHLRLAARPRVCRRVGRDRRAGRSDPARTCWRSISGSRPANS